MTIEDLIEKYQLEIDKLVKEKKHMYVDEFEIEWTISLYQEFLSQLSLLNLTENKNE